MLDTQIDIWKTNIETQKHFNDLIIKIRERAITVLGAGLVAAAFLTKDGYYLLEPIRYIHLLLPVLALFFVLVVLYIFTKIKKASSNNPVKYNYFFITIVGATSATLLTYSAVKHVSRIKSLGIYYPMVPRPSIAGVLVLALAFVWIIFYVMDRLWYHRLLKGAVDANTAIEPLIMQAVMPATNIITPSGLGQSITTSSSVNLKLIPITVDSTSKIDIFYSSVLMGLVLISLLLFKSSEIVQQNNKDIDTLKKEYNLLNIRNKRQIDSLKIIISSSAPAKQK